MEKNEETYEMGEIRRKSEKFLKKLDSAINICKKQMEEHKSPYVALSGGKDSGVLAYIVNEAARETGRDYRIWSHVSDASFPGTVETVKKIAESLKKEVLFELGVAFLKLFDLLGSEDIAVIHFNGGVLLYPFTKSRLGDAVFLAELCLGFAILIKGYKGFFKVFVIFCVVVSGHKRPPFLCVVYCNR